MLETKLIEIRDSGTRIDVTATRMSSESNSETSILKHNGYSRHSANVILTRLDKVQATNDPYYWNDNTTLHVAHKFIIEHFTEIPNTWVVDVQVLRGENSSMKLPERFDYEDSIVLKIKKFLVDDGQSGRISSILSEEYNLTNELQGPDKISMDKYSLFNLGLRVYEVINDYFEID